MLKIQNIKKHFGGIYALNGCSLEVQPHSITGMIGPNGSGKTTLFNVITGFYRADEGDVYFHEHRIHGLQPDAITMRGLVRTFQLSRVFSGMTVLENMMLAAHHQQGESVLRAFLRSGSVQRQEHVIYEKAVDWLNFVNLYEKREERAGNLSYGQQKLLEFARALMVEPSLLLLDEPTAGVNPLLTEQMAQLILQLREQGMTFFVIEHNMEFVKKICDRVIVLDYGKKIAEGIFTEIQKNTRVIEAYLGVIHHAAASA